MFDEYEYRLLLNALCHCEQWNIEANDVGEMFIIFLSFAQIEVLLS